MDIVRCLAILFFISFLEGRVCAELTIVPPDLNHILEEVSKRQPEIPPELSATIILKDDRIIFVSGANNLNFTTSFNDKSPMLFKHLELKNQSGAYRIIAYLRTAGKEYKRYIGQIHKADALIFLSDEDVFIYTQSIQEDNLELNEWIYAFKPNHQHGSQWEWVFKSESWEWPLSMEMDENAQAVLNRNLPIPPKMPINKNTKDSYLLQMMIKFKAGDQIKNYFPFTEKVGFIAPVSVVNKEGIIRQVNMSVSNSSIIKEDRPRPKHGLDFSAWDDYWESAYIISVDADKKDYPLLLGPF